jgi:hypothetical protein
LALLLKYDRVLTDHDHDGFLAGLAQMSVDYKLEHLTSDDAKNAKKFVGSLAKQGFTVRENEEDGEIFTTAYKLIGNGLIAYVEYVEDNGDYELGFGVGDSWL